VAWHAEARRVADLVAPEGGTRVAGYGDDIALAIVGREDAAPLVDALERAAASRAADAPAWHAGVVAASPTLEGADALIGAASDAAGVAELSGTAVHRWSVGDARLAPDVVVVEDDAALADMLRYALDTQGYSHRVFGTGTEALEALRTMRPRSGRRPLVLLDVELPGLDGHSLHERLRLERPGVFAVVFATVHGSEGEQLRALRAGALDYIVKPVSLRVLMAKIPNWMAAAGELRA
jgi:CheY-like chemotaxis protein